MRDDSVPFINDVLAKSKRLNEMHERTRTGVVDSAIDDEWNDYNGGYDNAYTSLTDTNYHFECSNEAFEEALDRLSQFFISPNFSESAAAREVNAVDSEFSQALQHDGWHLQHLQ